MSKMCYRFFGGLLSAQANWLNKMAEKGGRIATNATIFNRELLIVEKENDGKPFELPAIVYQTEIMKARREAKTREW